MTNKTRECKYGDPHWPCQDGLMCHYEGVNPMMPPAVMKKVQERFEKWFNPKKMTTMVHETAVSVYAEAAYIAGFKAATSDCQALVRELVELVELQHQNPKITGRSYDFVDGFLTCLIEIKSTFKAKATEFLEGK